MGTAYKKPPFGVPTIFVGTTNRELIFCSHNPYGNSAVPTTFVGTALFPQGLLEQKIGSLLAVPTNLLEQLFPQRLWEHQMEASYWLFPQICRNRLLSIILPPAGQP